MANDYLKRSYNERLEEINQRLEESHLSYLQTEDTPLKLDQRQKLEGIIKEFLCFVQNDAKYKFPSTADIFHRSAATVQNFSGYRACTAWGAISLYAANLLAQPWRKEYRTLRTYSGYYKHEVEANLIGAEVMFELMGYKHTGLGVLTLEGPIDPDKVSYVSRDAIVASVECQILKEIWEGVSKNFTISWLEILEFRENHAGTPDQAIRALNYRFHEKLRNSQTKPDPYLSYPYVSPAPAEIISPSIQYPVSVTNYNTSISCGPEYSYLGETGHPLANCRLAYPENYGNHCNSYGYRTTKHFGAPYHTTLPTCTSRVPTGCLIELDPPNHEKLHSSKMNQKNCLDEVDFCHRQMGNLERKSSTPSSNAENWEYVYAGLKSTGYSKDLGDRDDILTKREITARNFKHKVVTKQPTEFEEKFMKYEKRKMARSQNELENATNSRSNNYDHICHKKKSSLDAADLKSYIEFPTDKLQEKSRKNYQTMPNLNIYQAKETTEQISQYMKDLKIQQDDVKEEERWPCSTCTYFNLPKNSICEMCLKSKHKGNEDVPLASGGKECPKCTLVNEKDVLKCTACDEDLTNSPTYI